MKIYFVRHGESEGNVQNIIQPSDSPLSDIGHAQGRLVAHRFKSIPIDVIVSSKNIRAQQTAEHISKATSQKIVLTELLCESRKPSEMIGLQTNHEMVHTINQEIIAHFDDPTWYYSDEENFSDLKKRADKALEFLITRNEANLAVVTHSGFIRLLLWSILQPGEFDPTRYIHFHTTLRTSNGGISVCDYSNGKWRVLTINDDAHLG